MPNQIKSRQNYLFVFTGIGLGLTSLYGLYRLTKKNSEFNPTSQTLNTFTFCPISTSIDAKSTQVLDLPECIKQIKQNKITDQMHLTISDKKSIPIRRGIHIDPHEKLIFLSSRGYAKRNKLLADDERELVKNGGCAIAARILIQDNIVHNHPLITFDYPDDKDTFSFGQDADYQCLKTIWNTVSQKYPNANIIGIGDCRRSSFILRTCNYKT